MASPRDCKSPALGLCRFDSCSSHQWREQTEHDHGDHETPVVCTKCGCPGMLDQDGDVFWPAT